MCDVWWCDFELRTQDILYWENNHPFTNLCSVYISANNTNLEGIILIFLCLSKSYDGFNSMEYASIHICSSPDYLASSFITICSYISSIAAIFKTINNSFINSSDETTGVKNSAINYRHNIALPRHRDITWEILVSHRGLSKGRLMQ